MPATSAASQLVRKLRRDAGLSLRGLADAAGVATSTVHRIERGDLQPTIETLVRIAEAAGTRLRLDPEVDYAASLVGLALSIQRSDATEVDPVGAIRRAAEFAQRFIASDKKTRHRMVAAEPPTAGDPHWDAFIGALAEWLSVRVGAPAPAWVHGPGRYLDHGWWVTSMRSLQAWEFAGSPVSFQSRGVYLHRDSLTNV